MSTQIAAIAVETEVTEVTEPVQELITILTGITEKSPAAEGIFEELLEARRLWDCLPLATADYSLGLNRLRNAVRFVASEETGAAQWELRMFLNWLRQFVETPTADTMRRSRIWEKLAKLISSD